MRACYLKQKINLACPQLWKRFHVQFVIFNPWKFSWNWTAFSQNSIVISPRLLYHPIKRDTGRLANEAFSSNPIVSSNQNLSGLRITIGVLSRLILHLFKNYNLCSFSIDLAFIMSIRCSEHTTELEIIFF